MTVSVTSCSVNLCPKQGYKQGPPKLNPKLTPKSRHNVDGWWTSVTVSTLYVDRGVLVVYIFGHLTVLTLVLTVQYTCRVVVRVVLFYFPCEWVAPRHRRSETGVPIIV